MKTFEYLDTFYSKITDYYPSKAYAHKIGTQKGYFRNLFKTITPEDRNLIEWYRDGGYREIADFIYNKKKSNKAHYPDNSIHSLKDCIARLDSILENPKIRKDIVLWKGIREKSFYNLVHSLSIGDTYTFKNFFSTSINYQYALFAFARIINKNQTMTMMKINCPAGTKGAYISHDVTENEVLLQRNQTIKLKNIYQHDIGKQFKNHKGEIVTIYEFDLIV